MTISRLQQQRDAAVLELLCALPTHPYDLEQQLLAMGEWWSRKGGVHKHLKGLQTDGLVTSAWDFPSAGPARLVYMITEEGRAYFYSSTSPVSSG